MELSITLQKDNFGNIYVVLFPQTAFKVYSVEIRKLKFDLMQNTAGNPVLEL